MNEAVGAHEKRHQGSDILEPATARDALALDLVLRPLAVLGGEVFSASTWIAPGRTELTQIPYGPSARARERDRPATEIGGTGGAVVLLDDLHAADAGTHHLLVRLARSPYRWACWQTALPLGLPCARPWTSHWPLIQ